MLSLIVGLISQTITGEKNLNFISCGWEQFK